jgi:nucleotide-binding universal stress UspA family protein
VAVDEKHNEGQAAAWLAEAEEILKKSEISPECQVLNGNVETAVADYVDQAEVDLLIAGAYGHSRIRKLLIGSTTSELLRRCHIPVLCFR